MSLFYRECLGDFGSLKISTFILSYFPVDDGTDGQWWCYINVLLAKIHL